MASKVQTLYPRPVMPLYHFGRKPDPLAPVDKSYLGGGRFDDPKGMFHVIYTGALLQTAFIEKLSRFQATPELLEYVFFGMIL